MLANSDIRKLYVQSENLQNGVNGVNNHDDHSNYGSNHGNIKRSFLNISMFGRMRVINLIAVLITTAVICRVVYLNTFSNEFLSGQMNTRVMRTLKITPMRGTIEDRSGNPLAVSTPVASIWADPTGISALNNEQLIKTASILNMPVKELNDKLNQKTKTFVYLKRAVTPEQATKIKELGIDGIYSIQEYKRFYPNANVDAHVVGFTNVDDNGAEGIEYANNSDLVGVAGQEQVMRDRQGHVIQTLGKSVPAENGDTITLSIDNKIQYIAYNALKNQVNNVQADGGSVVVLDSKTGEVLAMVNMPTYNPNNREGVTLDAIRNRAAIDIYEPGSIIKPLIVAKALNDGMVKSTTVFNTMPYSVGPKLIKDTHLHPSLTVAEIIQLSSDVGISKIGMKYKPQQLWSFYDSIGFGNKVGTDFPGEAKGILRPWNKWYPIDQATMTFGYGVSVSLLQMARAYTIFTNNGCLLPITFYKNDEEQIDCVPIVSPQVATELRTILADTVTDGTGSKAQTADYTVAGKTGTAHKAIAHGYAKNQYHVSFVGFAPAVNPRIIVAVSVDNPHHGSYYGGIVAAPIFSEITESTLRTLGVKPDKIASAIK